MRNIGYLRFGFKIRQGFTSGITSLTPHLSLSPLWISWTGNEGAREGAQLLYLGGACRPRLPPLHRAAGACRPAGGRQAPARGLHAKKIIVCLKCNKNFMPFLFLHFSKKKFTEIYFCIYVLQFYTPTARQVGGRDLYINKNKFFCAEVLGGCLPHPGRAAGSRPKYKTPPLPSRPYFLPTRSR